VVVALSGARPKSRLGFITIFMPGLNNSARESAAKISWVAASREIIAYYMDPRNSLNSTNIFQFENLSNSSLYNVAGVTTILKNTFMSGSYTTPDTNITYTYADTFMNAAQVSGVSPYHLAARARMELGSNGSALSSGTVPGYEKYYNFYNIGAYNTASAGALVNGAIYAQSMNAAYYLPWTNQYKAILGGAIIIGTNYISKGQNTLYFQKFNVVNNTNYSYYDHQYMSNVAAPTSESSAIKNAYSSDTLSSTAFVFNIPVYLNMPDSPAPEPPSTGDGNNLLSSLGVTGYSLSPSFNMYTQNYDLTVENSVSSVNVTASAAGSSAKVSGIGDLNLNEGNNSVKIVVTSSGGISRTYTLNIYRKTSPGNTNSGPLNTAPGNNIQNSSSPSASVQTPKPSTTPVPSYPVNNKPVFSGTASAMPVLKSNVYKIGTYITGISDNTSVMNFLNNFSVVNNGAIRLAKPDGSLQEGLVGTGNILQLFDSSGNLYKSYTIVIYGDVLGNGTITNLDLLAIQKHILKESPLTGPYLAAADVFKNGSVTSLNLLKLQRYILHIDTLTQ